MRDTDGIDENGGGTDLRADAVNLTAVLMQAITHMGPAAGLIGALAFITGLTGVVSPLAFFLAFLIILTLGLSVTQLAKHHPSAGGYYTYVSRTVSPKAGFLTSWMYFLYDPIAGPITLAFAGFVTEGVLKSEFDVTFPWWVFYLLATALLTVITWRGIKISSRAVVILGVSEIAIMVALAFTGLLSPGDGGLNLEPFNPANINTSGLYLGVVFGISVFLGFEAVAPIAEESRDPRRTQPRAIILAILILGAFYLIAPWGILIGAGTENVGDFAGSEANPVIAVGENLWGGSVGALLIVVALINSAFAVAVAAQNAVTRVYYAMGRSGAFPRAFAKVHPRHRTPSTALAFQTALNLLIGLGLGFWIGPDGEFFYGGVQLTLALIIVFGLGNLGVFLFYRGERRVEFNPFLHAVCPLVSTIALVFLGYKSSIPLPDPPVRYAPVVVAAWLVVGIALVAVLSRRRDADWLRRADQAFGGSAASRTSQREPMERPH